MSQISQKSISGITSITTPTGIDNQFTLHINDTSEALKLDHAGNIHIHNHVNTTGISSASNFKTGTSDLHSAGLNVAYADVDDFIDVGSNIKLGNAGVITATSFVGDGSDLTNLPAGLGTALSATASSPLNKMYYTNQVLGVNSNITVDVPASASKAYTQYADIKVDGSADLIVAEGDDLIPDILGLADFGTFGGGASAGRIRVNSISNAANDGSPTVQKGLVVTGVCTATSFSGSGANLTNLPAQATIANNADNRVITGGSGVNLNGESSVVINGGKLGIGVASPNQLIEVHGASNPAVLVQDTTNNCISYMYSQDSVATFGSASNHPVVFNVNNGEKARINSSGQMGLGTQTPQANAKLQVVGRVGATEFYTTTTSTPQTDFTSSISSNKAGLLLHRQSETNGDYGGLEFHNHPSSITSYRKGGIYFQTDGSGFGRGDMVFVNDGVGDSANLAISDEKMRIHKEGHVTKPASCAFNVTPNGNQSLGNGEALTSWKTTDSRGFENTTTGGYFSSGIFTAPVTGAYYFTSNILLYDTNGTNSIHLYWQKNGSGTYTYWNTRFNNGDFGYGNYMPMAGACTMYMSAGDTCRIRISFTGSNCGMYGGDQNWGNWGGFLIG